MGFFGKAKEALRDKTRDNVSAKLNSVGVEAKLAERGTNEEVASRPRWLSSLGLIEIRKSPINFVHIVYVQTRYGRYYSTLFLSHDPSVRNKEGLETRSKRLKKRPLIGKVIDVVWEGNLGEDILRRLNDDQYLKQELIRLRFDVKIGVCPDIGYWKMEIKDYPRTHVREKWDCFEIIARHLRQKSDW